VGDDCDRSAQRSEVFSAREHPSARVGLGNEHHQLGVFDLIAGIFRRGTPGGRSGFEQFSIPELGGNLIAGAPGKALPDRA